ncbi:hypothetical protein HXY33_00075 [Candidatus Bathyarchaeota archaeon]|nr:hypothetical protein [Candidatus Bathyarchaeota archaeon]
MKTEAKAAKKKDTSKAFTIDVRIPTRSQIVENPRRAWFIGGGWIDSLDPKVINLYWHRRQKHFTIYSLLQVLEHETLHTVLARIIDLETSQKLDNVHRSICVWLNDNKLVFVNEIRIKEWFFPPYIEEPTEDMLD